MREATVTAQPAAQSYIIKRPRLTKLLDESEARIILLCAPAGYGKTTLAREWVAGLPEPVAWYGGGVEMLDPAALGGGLADALASAGLPSELVGSIRAMAAENPPGAVIGGELAVASLS